MSTGNHLNELVNPSRMERTESFGTETKNLVFAVNGHRYELATVDPSTTVLEFLRLQTHFKSVKLGCGEGLSSVLPLFLAILIGLLLNFLLCVGR